MYTLKKEFKFEAAHMLVGHDGKCARLHGHSWKARVVIQGETLATDGPKSGMLIDFGDVKKMVDTLVERFLDHRYLNETLKEERPTSEFVARWLYDKLNRAYWGPEVRLVCVEVDETCTSSCAYEEVKV